MRSREQPPRVMILTSTPGGLGGMERATINLTRMFTQQGYHTRCVFPLTADIKRLLEWSLQQGVEAEASAAFLHYNMVHTLVDTFRLRAALSDWRPCVVSLHYPVFFSLKDILAVRLAGVRRCVVTMHAIPPESLSSRQRRMTRLTGRLADAVVVHSRQVGQALIADGVPAEKVTYFPYGLHLPATVPAREAARARLGLPAEAFLVGTNARLVAEKGVAELIKIVAQLPSDEAGPYLLIAGEGEQREDLAALVAARLGPRGRLLGHLGEESLADFYAALDVFAQTPIWQEAFGLVYIEAAQFGIPSVSWRSGGIAEAVIDGETGLLVEQQDLEGLGQAITRLRCDPFLRTQLGQAARARAYSEFTEARMAEDYANILHLPGSNLLRPDERANAQFQR